MTALTASEALAAALSLLDSFAGEGLGHVYGNGQVIDASSVCEDVSRAFGVTLEPGWYRTVGQRIEALERACGAAASAGALDTMSAGVKLTELPAYSRTRMCLEVAGVDLADPYDLLRFRREYMTRFHPAPRVEMELAPNIYPSAGRRVLLLASYCGGELGCSKARPCNDCLAMCNVAEAHGTLKVFGGLDFLAETDGMLVTNTETSGD